jgi:hypothetical protein
MYEIIGFEFTDEGTDEGVQLARLDTIKEVTDHLESMGVTMLDDVVIYESVEGSDLVVRNWRGEEWLAEFAERPSRAIRYLKHGDIFRSPSTGLLRRVISIQKINPTQVDILSEVVSEGHAKGLQSIGMYNTATYVEMSYPQPDTEIIEAGELKVGDIYASLSTGLIYEVTEILPCLDFNDATRVVSTCIDSTVSFYGLPAFSDDMVDYRNSTQIELVPASLLPEAPAPASDVPNFTVAYELKTQAELAFRKAIHYYSLVKDFDWDNNGYLDAHRWYDLGEALMLEYHNRTKAGL